MGNCGTREESAVVSNAQVQQLHTLSSSLAVKNGSNNATDKKHIHNRSISDLSDPSTPRSLEDLRKNSVLYTHIIAFTLFELETITKSFRSDYILGEGGFGTVYKGYIDENVRVGLKSLPVAVKVLNKEGLQGHREWLTEVNFLGQLRHPNLGLIMTSRELITGKSPLESLEINVKVSAALVEIVQRINTKPRYILAKGGITSSDIATKALGAKCAKIIGQALSGVPLWQLGRESRHPGVPYIVFPGNVGNSEALAEVVSSWALPARLSSSKEILLNAERGGYAVGAFNVYNLEGVQAVVAAAEEQQSPAILQIHPGALKQGGLSLVSCCIAAAERASVPISVHFDHGNSMEDLLEAIELGFDSVMADGSHLPFKENIAYTKFISSLAQSKDMLVEAELGRLSGTEDDLTVEDYEARLTDVSQAQQFIEETGIDALAVCIGNVHGKYPASGPNLRLDLLKDLHALSSRKGVFLVLHGASGLPENLIKACIENGVRKFNVNTEVRKAYLDSLNSPSKDLVHVMESAKESMKSVIAEKIHLFGSAGKAL